MQYLLSQILLYNIMTTELSQKDLANAALTKANSCLRQLQYSDGINVLEEALLSIDDTSIQWVLHFNIGSMYSTWGKHEEAFKHFILAEANCDSMPLLCHNIGLNYKRWGKYKEAVEWYRKGIKLEPDNASLHNNLATCLIAQGEWEEGFQEQEWRLLAHPHARNVRSLFNKPDWDGKAGKGTILLYNEQGRGDLIQNSRYIPLIKNMGFKTTLIVKQDMFELMRKCADKVLVAGEKLNPKYDLVCSVNSLPHLFKTTTTNVPAPSLLLTKKKSKVPNAFWKKFGDKTRIAICWAGSRGNARDLYRSVCNAQFSVLNQEGVQLFSVQKKDPAQSPLIAPNYKDYVDMEEHITDLHDVADILLEMDLVVTVDTAIAHLAGSLDIPTWVLIPVQPDARWLLDGSRTPWYPSMRLFRQTTVDDWNTPFADVGTALTRKLFS